MFFMAVALVYSPSSPLGEVVPLMQVQEARAADVTLTSGTQWTAPSPGVGAPRKATIEGWGGGGAGGAGTSASGGGGGGGAGAYAKSTNVTITPGQTYNYVLGAAGLKNNTGNGGDGGDTSFDGGAGNVMVADGGLGGKNYAGGMAGGAGGLATNCTYSGTGSAAYNGGTGGAAYNGAGGGGGGGESGSATANGNNGSPGTSSGGGAGGTGTDGYDGGAGGTLHGDGYAPTGGNYGGGGGGAGHQSGGAEYGGSGHMGKIDITYTELDAAPTTVLNSPANGAETEDTTPDLTATGTDVNGDEVEYNIYIDEFDTFDSSNPILANSYAETNQDENWNVSSTNYTKVSQSFISANGRMSSAKFYLKKVGSPTGNAIAALYELSGTHGTNAVPTGAALATSDNFDVSTLTTSYQLITFTFSGANRYNITAAYYYEIVFEYSGGDADNYVQVGIDGSSPSDSGNPAYYTGGSWTPTTAKDVIFYVYQTQTPLVNKNSIDHPGFSGTGDPHPWPSGNAVTYTVQDALTAGLTYYWKVKGKDPSGTNIWGAWSSTRSFTITGVAITYSGIAYQSEGGAALTSKTVKLYKNGSTLLGSTTSNASTGAWSISGSVTSGDILTAYVDSDTINANTIFVTNGSSQTDINLYGGVLAVRNDTGTGITNANLATGFVGGAPAGDMIYWSASNNLTASSSVEVHVWTGKTYRPGGTVTTQGGGQSACGRQCCSLSK